MRMTTAGGPARSRAAVLLRALALAAWCAAAVGAAGGAAAAPEPAAAVVARPAHWPSVTVVCRDGTRHDGVDLSWSRDGFLLRAARPRGDEITLAPLDVLRVLAPDGRDLTDEVGAACPAAGVDFRLLGRGARVPFRFTVMGDLGGGAAVATADGAGSPFAVLVGGLRLGVSPKAHVRLGLRRQSLTEMGAAYGSAAETAGTDLLLLVGLRLKDPRENDNYSYVEGGLAFMHLDRRWPGADSDVADVNRDLTGPLLQGGVVVPLSPTLGVDAGVTFAYRPSLFEDRDRHLLVGLNLALTLRGAETRR